jgi:hypothetical protein
MRERGHGRVALVRELFGLADAPAAEPEPAPADEAPAANVRQLRP